MIDGHDFDEMVDACRKAHEAVMEHGTAEMQAFTTALLHALAKEAAKCFAVDEANAINTDYSSRT